MSVKLTRVWPFRSLSTAAQCAPAKQLNALTPRPALGAAVATIAEFDVVRQSTSPDVFDPPKRQPECQHPTASINVDGAFGVVTARQGLL